jgi:hypothetical protein
VTVDNPPVVETPRPASFHGGLVPGENISGSRPLPGTAGKLTKSIIRSWTPAQMREAMNDPALAREMESLGIQVLRGTWEEIRERSRRR